MLTVQLEPLWILPGYDRVRVNKVDVVDSAIWDAKPSDACVLLNESASTEKVWVLVEVFISWCLTPALLIGVRSPRNA